MPYLGGAYYFTGGCPEASLGDSREIFFKHLGLRRKEPVTFFSTFGLISSKGP
jgi:hypothetical protein